MTKPARVAPETAPPRSRLLDAAERLLVKQGYAAVSARSVAEEAGLNHGLIHYYFGSMEELFVQVLERFTETLIARQRDMYSRDVPFLEKWRAAMGFLEEDLAAGYPKIWLELQAVAWNRPDLRVRVARVNAEWRSALMSAFDSALAGYDLQDRVPVDAAVSLVMTFNQGMMLERLCGVTDGHDELLRTIDKWLSTMEENP